MGHERQQSSPALSQHTSQPHLSPHRKSPLRLTHKEVLCEAEGPYAIANATLSRDENQNQSLKTNASSTLTPVPLVARLICVPPGVEA
jgi:hypothetical protein